MRTYLRVLWQYRELLWVWTRRDIQVRYKQSLLGSAWAILQPLSLMIVFSFVFSFLAPVPTGKIPYPIFSYTALLPWTFFATSISFAVPSLVNNLNLVTKVYFPREILPLAAIGASFVDFVVASVVFVGLMIYYNVHIWITILFFPLILLIQIVLTAGITFLASAINVFYRDIRFVVPLAVQLWMYATPIIYPSTLVPAHLRWLYMLNPMASIIESYRAVFIYGRAPDWGYLGLSAAISFTMLLVGYMYFKKVEPTFADLI